MRKMGNSVGEGVDLKSMLNEGNEEFWAIGKESLTVSLLGQWWRGMMMVSAHRLRAELVR